MNSNSLCISIHLLSKIIDHSTKFYSSWVSDYLPFSSADHYIYNRHDVDEQLQLACKPVQDLLDGADPL